MEELNYNNVLNIIEFLNVVDSSQFSATSRRHYYLVEEFRRLRGPEVVTVSSWDRTTFQQKPSAKVVSDSLKKLYRPPNLVLAFNKPGSNLKDELQGRFPTNTVILGACSHSIQVNLGPSNVESNSNASIMLASFAGAEIRPFCFPPQHRSEDIEEFTAELASKEGGYWKSVIVYAVGDGARDVEDIVAMIQGSLPNASIVGGICSQGYYSCQPHTKSDLRRKSIRQLRAFIRDRGGQLDPTLLEKSDLVELAFNLQSKASLDLEHVEDGVFGVVLGGEVPVRSVVSRGVKSTTHGQPQSTSPYTVKTVTLSGPDDPDFMFEGDGWKPIHMIQELTRKETGATITATDLLSRNWGIAEFVGVRRPHEDGFELHMLSPYCRVLNCLMLITDGSEAQMQSMEGAEVDFFFLDGEACCDDMDQTANMLREQTKGEQILGAIMFSCAGRGPESGSLIDENMADANRFAKVFPEVPCLGFYAGGEIGPMALAGNKKVFRSGNAAVQGYTAVFCLFVVPTCELGNYMLDDSPTAIQSFVKKRRLSP